MENFINTNLGFTNFQTVFSQTNQKNSATYTPIIRDDNKEVDTKSSVISQNMPARERAAFKKALDTLQEDQKTKIELVLSLNPTTISENSTQKTLVDYKYLQNKIESILDPSNTYTSASPQTKEALANFWSTFQTAYESREISSYETKASSQKEEGMSETQEFLQKLLEKGAIAFLAEMNIEKIEKLVEEFREKLLAEKGDSPEAMKEIEKLVADFKKQLLENLENSLDSSETKLKTSPIALVKTVLQMTESKNSIFSNYLQESNPQNEKREELL